MLPTCAILAHREDGRARREDKINKHPTFRPVWRLKQQKSLCCRHLVYTITVTEDIFARTFRPVWCLTQQGHLCCRRLIHTLKLKAHALKTERRLKTNKNFTKNEYRHVRTFRPVWRLVQQSSLSCRSGLALIQGLLSCCRLCFSLVCPALQKRRKMRRA